MSRATVLAPIAGSQRQDVTEYAAPFCLKAGIWTIHRSWIIEPHAMEELEINYLHTGEVKTFLDDGSELTARGGDVSIIQPGVRHHCAHDVMTPSTFLVLMVDPRAAAPFPPFSASEVVSVQRMLRRSRNHVVHACPETDAAFLALREALSLPAGQQKAMWFKPWVRNLMQRVIVCIVRSLVTPVRPPRYRAVEQARRLIERNLNESLSVNRIARAVGMSPTRLGQLFRQQIGCTPTDYRTRLRLEAACARLRASSASVTAIAEEFAFTHRQHFARRFRQYFGLSPAEYRLQAREDKGQREE